MFDRWNEGYEDQWYDISLSDCINHNDWINTRYDTKEKCLNKCNEAVREMVAYFSDLTVQVGTANGIYHCWCKDSFGFIVDPTSKQFECDTIEYNLIAERFLGKHEYEPATGAIFLDS